MTGTYDYIVVGAGAAGCVVASRLSEDPDIRVALIEAGGPDNGPLLRIPGLGFLAARNEATNWWFLTEPMAELNGRPLRWLQGKLVGGSSSINGMIYNRGHSREYDAWRQMGCEGWSFEDVLPYFRKAETNFRGADEWHGGSGPMRIGPAEPRLTICEAFLKACGEAGFPILDDLNRDTVDGFAYYDVNIDKGRRISVATAYLKEAKRRPNFTLLTTRTASRLIIEKGRVRGVELMGPKGVETIRAEREIVLSCGGIKSPQLLMLSGIGPGDELSAHGIKTVVDSPNVGKNLQNHPSYSLQFTCSAPVTAYRFLRPDLAIKAAAEYLFGGRGTLGQTTFPTGGFFRTDPRLEIPDMQVVMFAALIPKPGPFTPRLIDMLPKRHGFSLTIYQGTPYSRGEVRLRSANPADAPMIFPNYLKDRRDVDILIKGIQRMREAMRQPAIRKFIEAEIQPGDHVTDDAALEADIRSTIGTSHHQSGTCAMGGQPTSVVDPQLRVRGVEGLRIADTSIMPVMPNAALHGPTIMIGEKAAAMISGRLAA